MLPSFIQQTHIEQLLCAGSCIRKHRLSLLSARVYLIVLQSPHRGSPQACLAFSLEPGWPFCFPQWLGVLNAIPWIQLSAGGTEMTFFFFWSPVRETSLEVASNFVLESSVYFWSRLCSFQKNFWNGSFYYTNAKKQDNLLSSLNLLTCLSNLFW